MKTTTIIIAAVLLGGGYLYMQHEKAVAQGLPTLEDQANKALATETNPYTLEALAQKCDAGGLHNLAGLLHAKSQAILAFQTPQTPKNAQGDAHPSSSVAMLAAGVTSGATLTLHQALAQAQGGVSWLGQGPPPPPPNQNWSPALL